MRRFWTRTLILIGILAGVAVLAVVILAVVHLTVGSHLLAQQLAELAGRHLVDAEQVRVRIADVGGSGLTRFELYGVEVEVRTGEGEEWIPFLTAERVRARYRLHELWRGKPTLRSLDIVEPRIVLHRGGPLPRLKARAPAAKPGVGIAFGIGRLRIEGGLVERDSAQVALDLAAAIEFGGGHIALAIDSMGVRAADYPRLWMTGKAEVRGDSIALDQVLLAIGNTRVQVAGTLDGTRGAQLHLTLDPLDLEDAQAVTGATALLGRSGWVRGNAEINGTWDALDLAIDLQALVGEDRIDHLVGRGRVTADGPVTKGQPVTSRTVEIDSLALALNGVPFVGSGRLGLGRGRRDSHGRLEFEAVRLRDFPVLRDQTWMPEGTLSGVVTVGAETRGAEGGERPFDLTVTRGVVRGFVIAPGHFRGAIHGEGRIRLDEYDVTTLGAEITGWGQINPRGELVVEQELEISDLRALGGMLGERRFGGQGRASLHLAGPTRAPTFEAAGDFDSLAFGPAELGPAAVQISRGTFRPGLGMAFDVTAAGGAIAGRAIDTLAVAGAYQRGSVVVEHISARRGQNEVRAVATVDYSGDGTVIRLSELEATVRKQRWESPGPVRIDHRGNIWTFQGLNLTGALGALALSGTLEPGGQATALDLHLVDIDLASLGTLLGTQSYSGKLELSLIARGGGASSKLEFHAKGDSLRLKGFTAERLELIGSVHGETITISRMVLERGGTIEVAGDIRFPRPLVGFGALRQLGERAIWEEAVVDVGVRAPSLDLNAWHGIHPQLDRFSGTVDLTAAFTGKPRTPDGTIRLKAEKLRVGAEELGPIEVQGQVTGGLIVLDQQGFTLAGSPLVVSGTIPVRLSLLAAPVLDRDMPLALKVDLAGGSLGLARFVTDKVVDAAGEVNGVVELSGTLRAPLYNGAVDVTGGRLRLRGREETLVDLSGRLELAGDRIQFNNAVGSDGGEGRLSANGTLVLREGKLAGYDVAVELQHFGVGLSGEYHGELSGAVTFKRNAAGGLPVFTGGILVHKLDYLREVGRRRSDDAGPSSWVGRFEVDLPGKAWIRNADLEVELRGQVTYERNVSGRTILGQLETVRGRYTLFGHTFRITSGEILFTDPDDVDPELNVTGETRIPEARIFATITGRASDRQVVLTSDPDFDQASLWMMLVPSGTGEVTSFVAMTPFVSDLERTIFREIPGLSVSLEERIAEPGAQPTLGVRAGTYLGSEVFFSAYQGLAESSEQDVSLEYELSRRFFLKGSAVRRGVVEPGGTGGQDIEQEYNLDLNMRWEW